MKKSSILTMVASMGILSAAASQTGADAISGALSSNQVGLEADSVSTINLSEVAVVAQRADTRTPIAFTQLTAKEISRANNGVDIPSLLEMTPSVVTTSDAGAGVGYTSVRIRGSEGSRINVTANGVPINDAESHNVYWVNMPDFASSIKDIQVQRGVGTSTNGAGAFGGSINMATDAPSRYPFASFSGSYGMYNTHKETVKASTGLIGGHWSVEARLSNIGTDGYIDRASVDLWSYFAQAGWYGDNSSLRFIAFGGKERTYMAWEYASKEEMDKYGRRYNPCGKYTDKDGRTAFYKDQYDNYKQHHFHLLGRHSFSSTLSLDAALHFTKGDGYYEQYKPRRVLVEYGLEPFERLSTDAEGNVAIEMVKKSDLVRLKMMDNDFGGGLFNLKYTAGRVSAVLGGAMNAFVGRHFGRVAWVRNYVGPIDPLQEYYRNTGRKFDSNVFARANVDIVEGLSAYADMQYRHIRYTIKGVSDTYDYNIMAPGALDIHHCYDFFNPKAGLNYQWDAHRVYGSWSVAHKEPTRDNFVDADPDRQPRPERLFDYELGYAYTGKVLSAGVNLYYMDYKDQLVSTGQLSDTGNPIQENVPDSYRAGVELQLGLKPVEWFQWHINATISRNRIKNFVEYIYENETNNPITIDHGDTDISFSPSLTINNSFDFNWRGFDASIQSRYVGRQYLSNAQVKEQSLDPYFVTNLNLGYTFKALSLKSIRVGVAVNNIFSERYFNNGYAGTGYYVDNGEKVIYRYAAFAASAPANVIGSVAIEF